MKNIIVQLRIYRGKVTYNEKGDVSSDVQVMKIKFGRLEWVNFMKAAKVIYSKIEVIKCTDIDNDFKEISTPDSVLEDIEKALKGEEVELTPQEEIKELKKAVKKLKETKKEVQEESKTEETKESDDDNSEDELESLRKRYTELYGKKPSHLMKEAGLKRKIEEKS